MSQNDCCRTSADCCQAMPKSAFPIASTMLSFEDYLGTCKVRLGLGRMGYTVKPGLYAVGQPDKKSPVLVGANYKLSFDVLRKNLAALDCWLLILDTRGINVWCAAGKGTFGTEELLKSIAGVGLAEIVIHRHLVLPQLSASGVNSNEIARRSGFSVVFGPVRAHDIKQFIASDYKATPEMRVVKFTTFDRLVLTPIELIAATKTSLLVFGVLFLINLFAARPFGVFDLAAYAGAVFVGTVLTPLILPIIPGRAFAWKGWLLGLIWTVFVLWLFGWFTLDFLLLAIGYILLLPSVSAYLAMNFTGASTYTSPSGVLREMKIALPLIISASAAGAVLALINNIAG